MTTTKITEKLQKLPMLMELQLMNMEPQQKLPLMITMMIIPKKQPKHLLTLMELLLMNMVLPQKLPLKNMP
jgi:hypothetical protein